MTRDEQKQINKKLAEKYGMLGNYPWFRLSWSEDDEEWRHGLFMNTVDVRDKDGKIVGEIITDVSEQTRRAKKYNYINERWVLELLEVGPKPKDLVAHNGISYEPFLTFEENGDYVEPTWLAIDQAIYFARNKTLRGHIPTEEEISKRNQAKLREQFDDAIPTLPHALKHGHAVTVGGNETDSGGSGQHTRDSEG